MFDIESYLRNKRAIIDTLLDQKMPLATTRPAVLHQSMRYSVFGGGKRLRPILCLAAAESVGAAASVALAPAAAIELLHTYTLIHDDLPAMDDDSLRRGKPTLHMVCGEANAILAGDALLTLAFEWLAECQAPSPYPPNALATELARASGSQGVIAGQVEDLAAEGAVPTADLVEYIHLRKTADLFRAAVRMGAIAGAAKPEALEALTIFGTNLGLAFQIIDDILNATSSAEALGKTARSDETRGKMTYISVYGLEPARDKARMLITHAQQALQSLPGPTEPLSELARFTLERAH